MRIRMQEKEAERLAAQIELLEMQEQNLTDDLAAAAGSST